MAITIETDLWAAAPVTQQRYPVDQMRPRKTGGAGPEAAKSSQGSVMTLTPFAISFHPKRACPAI